jgi:hypothetical protein
MQINTRTDIATVANIDTGFGPDMVFQEPTNNVGSYVHPAFRDPDFSIPVRIGTCLPQPTLLSAGDSDFFPKSVNEWSGLLRSGACAHARFRAICSSTWPEQVRGFDGKRFAARLIGTDAHRTYRVSLDMFRFGIRPIEARLRAIFRPITLGLNDGKRLATGKIGAGQGISRRTWLAHQMTPLFGQKALYQALV